MGHGHQHFLTVLLGNDIATLASAGTSSVATTNALVATSLEWVPSPTEVVTGADVFSALGAKLDGSGIR